MILITYAYEAEAKFLKELVKGSIFEDKIIWSRFLSAKDLVIDEKVKLILNIGFAGALNQELALGQVILVEDPARLFTSKDPVTSIELRDKLRKETGADVVDMEGHILFDLAKANNLPIKCFKVISDMADNDAWQMVKQNSDKWSKALGSVVYEYLCNNSGI